RRTVRCSATTRSQRSIAWSADTAPRSPAVARRSADGDDHDRDGRVVNRLVETSGERRIPPDFVLGLKIRGQWDQASACERRTWPPRTACLKTAFVMLCAAVLSVPALALDSITPVNDYGLTVWRANGDPLSAVHQIAQDHDGYLWLATDS